MLHVRERLSSFLLALVNHFAVDKVSIARCCYFPRGLCWLQYRTGFLAPVCTEFRIPITVYGVLDVNDYSYTEDLACYRQDSLFCAYRAS